MRSHPVAKRLLEDMVADEMVHAEDLKLAVQIEPGFLTAGTKR